MIREDIILSLREANYDLSGYSRPRGQTDYNMGEWGSRP
jgi:hypothetical protein